MRNQSMVRSEGRRRRCREARRVRQGEQVWLGRERRRKRNEKGRRDGGTNEGESVVLELALLLEVSERRVPLCAWDDVGHAVVLCIRRIGGERRSRGGGTRSAGRTVVGVFLSAPAA